MEYYLRPLSLLDGEREWRFQQELENEINGFGNDGNGIALKDYADYLLKHVRFANAIGLEDNFVPQTQYWFCRNDEILGLVKIRHSLNEGLLEQGGHIGYAIHPSHRGKGYGKIMLKLALERALLKGLDQVLITVNDNNPASWKVVEGNGGRLWKRTDNYRWYWIIPGLPARPTSQASP